MSELFIFSRISGCLCTVSAADWDGWYRNRPYCPVKKEPGSYVKQSRQAHTSAYSVMLISAFLFWMLTEKSCGFFVCILTGMVRSTDGVRLKPLNKKKNKNKKNLHMVQKCTVRHLHILLLYESLNAKPL